SDLLSLLQLLDNPLQDLPVLAVLHSPLVGLTLDELAAIRLTGKGPFWTVLVRWDESLKSKVQSLKSEDASPESRVQSPQSEADHASRNTEHPPSVAALRRVDATRNTQHASPETFGKVTVFLDRFAHWRRLARQVSLSRCLEAVLAETHYAD